jgi:hypothetical protein
MRFLLLAAANGMTALGRGTGWHAVCRVSIASRENSPNGASTLAHRRHAMNELSRYFAHHPLENPANYLGTDFDPTGAAAYRLRLRSWKEHHRAQMRAPATPSGPSSRAHRHGPVRHLPVIAGTP